MGQNELSGAPKDLITLSQFNQGKADYRKAYIHAETEQNQVAECKILDIKWRLGADERMGEVNKRRRGRGERRGDEWTGE